MLKTYWKANRNGLPSTESKGHIIGNFAIERKGKKRNYFYNITHIPTGILTLSGETDITRLSDAKIIAKKMNEIPNIHIGELGKQATMDKEAYQALGKLFKDITRVLSLSNFI